MFFPVFALFQLLSPNVQFLTYSERAKWENSIMQHYHIQYSPKHKLAYIVLTVKVEMHYAAAV